jgi:Tfp pilus assembly protein PilO
VRRARRPLWRRLTAPAVGLLAVNLAVFAAHTLPRSLRVRSATERSAEARAELERTRRVNATLRAEAEAIRANAADAERFFRDMVGSERSDLLPLLEDVERMAREPGLKPGRRSFTPEPVRGSELTRVKVTLPLEGSYRQLVSFLGRVEGSSRFLTVDRVSLRGGDAGPATLQVELSAYFRDEGGLARER